MTKKVHVIHHTHWDFEWYFTTNESFIQLTYHMNEVFRALDEGIIDFYLLDGQMSILDDYLTTFPNRKEEILKYVTAGKLLIGPWYTQTDELIISGESMIRNLQIGMEMAEELGGVMEIGYLPDSFGQSKDMPKIYNGMGIESSVFWRGVPQTKTTNREFVWESEDGSSVAAVNIKNGYFIGVGLIYNDDARALMKVIDTDTLLNDLTLPVGGDQRYVDFNLKERIQMFNQQLEGNYYLEESNYPQLMEEIKKKCDELPVVKGEFISGSVSKIHRSIYSSRYDHKYLNDKIERRLIYQLEPLMVMLDNQGIPYERELLTRIWKVLLRNHAHDGAGGCNSDKTNSIILSRFEEADQLSYSAVDYLIRKISESASEVKENELFIFNTLPRGREQQVKIEISTKFPEFEIRQNGEKVSFQLLETRKEYCGLIRKKEEDYDLSQFYYIHSIILEVQLESLSIGRYEITESCFSEENRINQDSRLIVENKYYQLEFDNGQISLLNKLTNEKYNDVLYFENDGDDGDTYDYSPLENDQPIKLMLNDSNIEVKKGDLLQIMTINGSWKIPQNLISRKDYLLDSKLPYTLEIALKRDSKQLEFNLWVDNSSEDHRLRAIIKTNVLTDYVFADTPFGIVRRDVQDPNINKWHKLGWKEEPTSIYPMIHYSNLHNHLNSWTFFVKGIKEYQVRNKEVSEMALTLYRSVGMLGKPDLIRRPGIASGNEFKYIPTPDSQLKKKLQFKFAIQLDREYASGTVMNDFMDYAITIPFYQIQELNRFTSTVKYFVSNPLPNEVQLKEGLLEIVDEQLVFSSLIKNPKNNTLLLRVYNPELENSITSLPIQLSEEREWAITNFVGKEITNYKKSSELNLGVFKPGEIKTVAIKL